MVRCILTLTFLFGWSCICYGQDSYAITGIIKDKKGETLPGAAIYLSGYKIATVANNEGKFSLGNLKPGNYDVLVQVIGFLPQTKNVLLFDKSVSIEIILVENVTQLSEVEIKPDPNRGNYLSIFKKSFIGNTPNAEQCVITNPEVIQTDYNKDTKVLTVTASDFLIIENKALGYRIKYLLTYFENDAKENVLFYAGHPHFEEMEKAESKRKRYSKVREAAYLGSSQHFFNSLYHHRTKEDGFVIHKVAKIPNKDRPADSIINANLKRFVRTYARGTKLSDAPTDSLKYWREKKNEPLMLSILNRSEVKVDTLVKDMFSDVKSINYTDALYVIYTKEKESKDYTQFSGHSVTRPKDIPNFQISVVYQLLRPASFYENGSIFDPRSLLYEGYWAYEKVADMVPMDYIPEPKK
ncbi:carboxypeptidase-like regulatory domain-containing protein [Pedobacter sp. PWIIR3]